MILARTWGTVVATRKDKRLHGHKLLIVKPINLEGQEENSFFIAIDTVGAGANETVLVVQGSSARLAHGLKECPADAAIVGIVDSVSSNHRN